jgi:peptidoglycan/xylan/chitin deacetylase (PgdA/CDA1 family)
MAVTMSSSVAIERAGGCRNAAEAPWRNDPFSFWKLPEDWRAPLAPTIEDCERAVRRLLFEEYISPDRRAQSSALKAYYKVKKFIPAGVRHWINYAAVRSRTRDQFPHWPCETALIDFWRDWLRSSLDRMGQSDAWHIGFWPEGKRCCIVLTHDVESEEGFERIEAMADLEERYGFRSAWNLPMAQFPLDWKRLERLQARGFEIGAHGLAHDGRMFRSAEDFEECRTELERIAAEHGLRGYRGPSTLRNPQWIGKMAFDYDSSFSDTDPYEPQPGGTCSLFPFFLSRMVELPYTLPQDHTLIHLVRRNPVSLWATKARWIQSLGGMILTLIHPDYSGDSAGLASYEELLKILAGFDDAWRALPREVAQWWRERAQMRLLASGSVPSIQGPGAMRAVARRVSEESFSGQGGV